MTEKKRHIRGTILTLAGGTAWGFSGTCGQYIFANSQMESGMLAAIRMLGAGSLLLIFCAAQMFFFHKKRNGREYGSQNIDYEKELRNIRNINNGKEEEECRRKNIFAIWRKPEDAVRLVIFAMGGLMFSQYAYLTAISHSNSGTATVFQNTGIIMIMILSCLFSRRWPKRNEVAAAIFTLTGIVLIATHGNLNGLVISGNALKWGMLAAIALVTYTLLPGKLLDTWGTPLINGYAMLMGGVVMAVKFRIWQANWNFDVDIILAITVMILFGTVISFTFYMQGVADIGPVKASMLACIEPVVATIVSALWLKTEFALMDLIGFILIIGACLLVSLRK